MFLLLFMFVIVFISYCVYLLLCVFVPPRLLLLLLPKPLHIPALHPAE